MLFVPIKMSFKDRIRYFAENDLLLAYSYSSTMDKGGETMSQFEVITSKTRQVSNNEEQISNRLKQIERELEQVMNNLHIDNSAIQQVKRNLRVNMQNVTTLQQRVHLLSTTLAQISSLYESTEKSVAGTSVNRSRITEAISKVKNILSDIADKIRQTTRALGIDSSSAYSSDPVNLCNGNYVYENTFLEMDTVMDMKFRIFYNIQNNEIGALGRGWTHSYEIRMIAEEDRLDLQLDDGSKMSFQRYEDGLYYPLNGTIGACVESEEGTTFTDKESYTYHFDKSGKILRKDNIFGDSLNYIYNQKGNLEKIEDNYGNQIHFKYNSLLQISEISDHSGRKIHLTYKGGQLSTVENVEGRTIRYEYEEHGWLYKLINASGATGLINSYDEQGRTIHQEFPDGGTVDYEYLDDTNQVIMTEQNGNRICYEHDAFYRISRIVYEDGEERYTYDSDHNNTSYTDKLGHTFHSEFDANGNRTEFINPLNDKVEYSYTDFNQVESVTLNGELIHRAEYNTDNRLAMKEDANGGKEYFIYDEKGNVINWIRPDGSSVDMEYNDAGYLTSITNAMGGKTIYEYDARHNVTAETDPLGNRTEYSYNDANELVRVVNAEGNVATYLYDKSGNPVSLTDYNDHTMTVIYNAFNRPVKIIDADGNTTTYEYDQMWNLVKQIDPEGTIATLEYDKLQRVTRFTNPAGGVNEFEYDACNNLVERKDPNGGIHKIEYDALNRPVKVTDPCGHVVRSTYDAQSNVTEVIYEDGSCEKYTYDLLGNMTSSQMPDGYKKYYTYDVMSNLIKVSDDDFILEEYEYYPDGLIKKEKYLDGTFKEYEYDLNENLIHVINEEGGKWTFTYDCMQRVIKAEDPAGSVESYEYDPMGNIKTVINGTGERTSYTYNAAGLTESVIDAEGHETRYLYDKCNRLSHVLQSGEGLIKPEMLNHFNENQKGLHVIHLERDGLGNVITQTDAAGKITRYEYDGEGRIISQTDADGNITGCEYNPDGTQKSFTFADGRSIQLSYNGLKQLIQMEDWLGITRIQVDRMGRTKSVTTPDDKTISYEWGIRGEQRSITYPDGKKVEYHYDNQMRLASASLGEDVVSYDYYDNGRLKEKMYPHGFSTQYSYLPSGNISQIAHKNGQQIIEKSIYQYDKNNRKSKVTRENAKGSGIYEYQYNPLGSLTKVLHDGAEEEHYRYDPFGNRIWSKTYDQEAEYTYNVLNQMTEKKDSQGIHQYSYDNRGNLRTETLDGIVTREYTFDALNRLRQVTDGPVTVDYTYNGNGNRVRREIKTPGGSSTSRYIYDISREVNNLLGIQEGNDFTDMLWDGSPLGTSKGSDYEYYLNDERMTPLHIFRGNEILSSYEYDSFGVIRESKGNLSSIHGFTGHRMDYATGLIHADAREYDPANGRFISMDLMPAAIAVPLTFNLYSYCGGDPVNFTDPSGLIAAWLAGGIVGAVANVAVKAAGDVVKSVTTGKIQVSSWQDYVGTATGGFVQGSTFVAVGVATGGNITAANMAASAAGAATETFVSNGLKMATGASPKGYSWKNLVADTAKSGISGASTGAIFGAASKYIKIPGINKGRGSYEAVWKQVMTKAAKGQIHNIMGKTLYKGIVAYGLVKFGDEIISQGKKFLEDKGKELMKNIFNRVTDPDGRALLPTASIMGALGLRRVTARCPAGA